MCPNNDTKDHRDARTRVEETVSALKAFGPSFTKRGIQGFVEPLGFPSPPSHPSWWHRRP